MESTKHMRMNMCAQATISLHMSTNPRREPLASHICSAVSGVDQLWCSMYAVSSIVFKLCGSTCVGQSWWCNTRGANYVAPAMWCKLGGAVYVV
eukprot:7866467-Pyramimonas_sp.AAC.1